MLAVILFTAAAFRLLWPAGPTNRAAGQPASEASQKSQARQLQPPAPVLAVAAAAKEFPVIIRGIGTVQAFNTVTVKSRADGNIVKISFREGQFVHAGDPLVQIDPRPYQAQRQPADDDPDQPRPRHPPRHQPEPH